MPVVFGIKRVDVTDAATHKEEDDGIHFDGEARSNLAQRPFLFVGAGRGGNEAVVRLKIPDGRTQKSRSDPLEKISAGHSAHRAHMTRAPTRHRTPPLPT